MGYFSKSITIASLSLILTIPAFSQAIAQSSSLPKKEIQGIVKDYLLEHPEIIIESLQNYEKRKEETRIQKRKDNYEETFQAVLESPVGITVGNPKGKATIVEFFDYNCGYCRSAANDINQLIQEDSEVKVILRDFPILGQASVDASRVALAVKLQFPDQKMYAYHLELMKQKGRVNGEKAKEIAKKFGADMTKLDKDLESNTISEALTESEKLGSSLGLQGTPAFLLGGEVIPGAIGKEALKSMIKNIKACGAAEC